MVFNSAKFDICTFTIFARVKVHLGTYTCTDRIVLFILDYNVIKSKLIKLIAVFVDSYFDRFIAAGDLFLSTL